MSQLSKNKYVVLITKVFVFWTWENFELMIYLSISILNPCPIELFKLPLIWYVFLQVIEDFYIMCYVYSILLFMTMYYFCRCKVLCNMALLRQFWHGRCLTQLLENMHWIFNYRRWADLWDSDNLACLKKSTPCRFSALCTKPSVENPVRIFLSPRKKAFVRM